MYDIFGENTQNNPGGFDSMLEILPEELDVNLVTSFANSASGDSSRAQSQQPTHTHEQEMDSLFSITQPIDLVNHQNGEIAQLWSFNVDEFMMTPNNSSDSATISAPNSYNSESQSHPHTSNNWSHLLSNPFHQETGAQHLFANSQGNLRTDDQSFHPTMPTKRSSSQLTKAMTDDGGIPLTSSGTVNSVRKNSITRPISSTSLSSYRQNSVQELPKKPQVQCFNCKTFKTPLWRRDAQGNTLCNACGLFQKLHGTMRPLSLKSDVIRKRNTKKRSKKVVTADPNDKPRPRKKLEQDSLQELPVPLPSTPITTTSTGGNKKTTSQTLYNNIPTLMTGSRSSSSTNITGGNVSFNTGSSSMPSTQLNSNVLMNHNKRMFSNSGNGSSRKSRRSSTSSSTSNSSNRSSSSRSVVPILPKPSPGNTTTSQNQFQFVNNIPGSANNSGASSPRFSNSPRASFSTTSPLSSSTGQVLSSSGGRLGIVIPRRKSSRQMMSSSSFMAASLQQHHQQQQQQQQQPPPQQANQQTNVAGSSSSTISAPSSWSSTAITAPSPKTGRSPRSPFDLFSPQEPQSRPSSRKSHTSLLSQQLQQATILSQYSQPSSQSQTPVSYPNGANSTASTPQPSTLKRSPMTASPRNSYVDSIQQQRGLHSDGRLENSYRRASSLRVETNEKNSQNSHKQKENVMDDLEWLKFGL